MITPEIQAKLDRASAGKEEAISQAVILFRQMLKLMALLRSPGGCPWDREQSLASLRQYVREEADEVCEAIDRILEFEDSLRKRAGIAAANPNSPAETDEARTESKGLTIAHHPHHRDFNPAASTSGAPMPGNIPAEEQTELETLYNNLYGELGDLLLQSVFQGDILLAMGRPGMEQVLQTLVEKLIRRHPHVFGDVAVKNSSEVLANWENIKRLEKTD